MRKLIWLILIIAVGLIFFFIWKAMAPAPTMPGHEHMLHEGYQHEQQGQEKILYQCPMHPSYTSDKPGDCPICGMKLVPMEKKSEKEMQMKPGEVMISPEKQQLIGVRKEKVAKKTLQHQILAVGKIAYDPELYLAQEEYLLALKSVQTVQNSNITSAAEQTNSILLAAEKKLLLLGMSKNQIEGLAKSGAPQENLYLPALSNSVWVYITLYEYEMGLVKEGASVEIETLAFPGEIFHGTITAINPILNSQTRSIQARAEIKNQQKKLKPEMFVNTKIKVNLGEKLAVAETAVLDTGLRKIVYLEKENNILESHTVVLGQKADGYFEVLDGLKEGDVVVTSGNFLVDSESKLKSAAQTVEHKHGN
jgi:Cu(I)/Ag(I) efflux system membrane fusion protein